MEYNSFYGGRRGASFVIVHTFRAISMSTFENATGTTAQAYEKVITAEMAAQGITREQWYKENVMVEAFKQGGDYEIVGYDEYVLIDTIDKNHKDNGKIFRRGYDYTNSIGGAIYEGQIVGPAGPAPLLNLGTEESVQERIDEAEKLEERLYRAGQGEYTESGKNLIPGKDGNKFNDKITWNYVSIRDINDRDTEVWMGFTFPYLVLEFDSVRTIPYKNGTYTDMTKVTRTDDKAHPYYEKWRITIPDGVKGDALKNFRVYTPTTNETMKDFNNTNQTLIAGKEYLVYDYYNYDVKENGNPVTLYLGVYNMIKDITVADNGTITISYTNANTLTKTKLLKWITKVELTNKGVFTVTYNNDRTTNGQGQTYSTTLTWVKALAIAQDGTVTTTFNTDATSTATTKLKWIEDITVANDGTITYKYNTKDVAKTQSKQIKWLTGSSYNVSTGKLTFTYNTGATEQYDYKYIGDVTLSDAGVFLVKDNTGATLLNKTIKWPKDITLVNDKLRITYNDNTTKDLSLIINSIDGVDVPSSGNYAYHLLIHNSAASYQGNITHNSKNGWTDLGLVKDYDGILIGLNIDTAVNTGAATQAGALSYLNSTYPNGLSGNNLDGKIVTAGKTNETKKLYSFDYQTKKWFYLGMTDSSSDMREVIVGKETDTNTQNLADEMAPGSIWFIVE